MSSNTISQIIGTEGSTKEVNVPGKNILLFMTEDVAMRAEVKAESHTNSYWDEDDNLVKRTEQRINLFGQTNHYNGGCNDKFRFSFSTREAFEKFREFISQVQLPELAEAKAA